MDRVVDPVSEHGKLFGIDGLLAVLVPGVDAMQDAGCLEPVERLVIRQVPEIAAGLLGVPINDERTVREARSQSGSVGRIEKFIIGLEPGVQRVAKVGQWVTQGGDLPVDDGRDLGVAADHHIMGAVIAMDQNCRTLLGHGGHQQIMQLMNLGVIDLGVFDRRIP